MGVFSRLFSREDGAAHDTRTAEERVAPAPVSESAPGPSAQPGQDAKDADAGERTSVLEVPIALIELTEDLSSELAEASEPEERLGDSTVRRSGHAPAVEEQPISQTVKRPPKLPPPAPRRNRTVTPAPLPVPQPIGEAVDDAIDALLASDASGARFEHDHAGDRQALLETFQGVAKLYVQPLRELLFQLSNGPTPRAWADACRPLFAPLIHSAQEIGLPELVQGLSALDRALSLAAIGAGGSGGDSGALIGAASRHNIQEAYARLGSVLPEAFGAPRTADGRRTILLESLLLQVPGLHRRGIAKLYAAGLCSVSQLAHGSPDDLSQTTGIDRELATTLIEHVRKFERERSGVDDARQQQKALGQLRTLASRLSQLQSEFERAEQTENREAKKALRRARETTVLNVQVVLAELGELSLLEELKRCSVRAKLERIEAYLLRSGETR